MSFSNLKIVLKVSTEFYLVLTKREDLKSLYMFNSLCILPKYLFIISFILAGNFGLSKESFVSS